MLEAGRVRHAGAARAWEIVLGAVERIRGRGQGEGGADGEVDFAEGGHATGVVVLEMPPPATRSILSIDEVCPSSGGRIRPRRASHAHRCAGHVPCRRGTQSSSKHGQRALM